MTRWRLVDSGSPPRPGADNMAIDRALAQSVEAGGAAALRLYYWDPPCLSLGRNQVAAGIYDPTAAAARGIDIVRRPTGGRAVLHDRELTYCVAVRVGELGSPRATYAAINRALVAGLRRLGVAANVVGEGSGQDEGGAADAARAGLPGSPGQALGPEPCFNEAAPGEVAAGGRKLIGSAQRREGGVLLQHGSLLLDDDQSMVIELLRARALGEQGPAPATADALGERDPAPAPTRAPGDEAPALAPVGAPRDEALAPAGAPRDEALAPAGATAGGGALAPGDPAPAAAPALQDAAFSAGPASASGFALALQKRARPATLRALLGRLPGRGELESALVAGFEEALGIRLAPHALSAAERAAVARWRELFASAAWTWRR